MLLQLENTGKENVEKLLAYARANDLQLSLVDDSGENYLLPGKPLNEEELTRIILNSRKSGVVPLKAAHEIIRNSYNAD